MIYLLILAVVAVAVLGWIVLTQQRQIRTLTSVAISKHSTLEEQSRISTEMVEDRREIKLVPSYMTEGREADLELEMDDGFEEEESTSGE